MPEDCELCASEMRLVYAPEGSQRGLKVYLCPVCGLVQSLPRIDRAPRRPAAVSGGADWGNIRYGKGFRTDMALSAIARHSDMAAEQSCLDVGSNRGRFAKAFLAAAPHAHVTAVEPDERVAHSCAGMDRCDLIEARIEDATLADERFDIVHSCHTIEHLAHPLAVLRDHWRVMKPGGLLVLDCPNLDLVGSHDIVEEWFIDKHLYHFTATTLNAMLLAAGFAIVEPPNDADRENLFVVARKAVPVAVPAFDPAEAAKAEALIATYRETRPRNIAALQQVAAEIGTLMPDGVAVWGAGRIFDSLVRQGGLAADRLSALIDVHLKDHVAERFGCPLSAPEALAQLQPKTIVVMSRSFAAEIEHKARALVPDANIVRYSDLLDRALHRKTA